MSSLVKLKQLEKLERNLYREEKLRDMHPGLKELWDEYQSLVVLVQSSLQEEPRLVSHGLRELRRAVRYYRTEKFMAPDF